MGHLPALVSPTALALACGTSLSSSRPAATTTEPPGASQRSAPSGSCPHPKQRLYLSSISRQLRASGSGHPAACPDTWVTVTPWRTGLGVAKPGRVASWRAGGGGCRDWALSPSAPAVTHAALRHGGSPVLGGPRPHASSHPGHSIPGGWANTGCKTHTARTRGSALGTHGCWQPPLANASQAGGAASSPLPDLGDSPQGRQLLSSGPPCVQRGPGASAGPCAEQVAVLPPTCVTPNGDPRVWMQEPASPKYPSG